MHATKIAVADKLRVCTSPSVFPHLERPRLFALEKGIEDEREEVVYVMSSGGFHGASSFGLGLGSSSSSCFPRAALSDHSRCAT